MLRGIVPSLEKHHKVRIMDEGLTSAVRLSHRYLAGRQLPDKAVSILDTACARLALGQSATPPAIEDAGRQLDDLEVQRRILEREMAIGADHAERLAEIAKQKVEVEARLKALQRALDQGIRTRFEDPGAASPNRGRYAERLLLPRPARVTGCRCPDTCRGGCRRRGCRRCTASAAAPAPAANPEALRAELAKLEAELAALQGETPMMRVAVDAQIVGEVLSAWTGIPVGKMLKNEISTVLSLSSLLGKRVIGQDARLGYDRPTRADLPRRPR